MKNTDPIYTNIYKALLPACEHISVKDKGICTVVVGFVATVLTEVIASKKVNLRPVSTCGTTNSDLYDALSPICGFISSSKVRSACADTVCKLAPIAQIVLSLFGKNPVPPCPSTGTNICTGFSEICKCIKNTNARDICAAATAGLGVFLASLPTKK